jgi:hypothetical protein
LTVSAKSSNYHYKEFQLKLETVSKTDLFVNGDFGLLVVWNNIATLIISAIGSIATAAALYFVWKQAHMAQREVTTTLRLWLGSVRIVFEGRTDISDKLKNHGRLPAKVLSHKLLVETHDIKMEILQDKGKEIIDSFSIAPDGERIHIIRLDENDLTKISGKTWFLGFLFDYSYANNLRGKYGVIARTRPGETPFEIMDELME